MISKLLNIVKWVAGLIVLSFVAILAFSTASTVSRVAEQSATSSERKAVSAWADAATSKLENSDGKAIQFDELKLKHEWNYESRPDPMSSKTVRYATIEATEGLKLRGRDGINNVPVITIRRNADKSIDAMVQINRGQFVCRVGGCKLLVRFDDSPAADFQASEPSDYDSKTLFFLPGSKFLQKLEKARVVRVEATLFHEGNHVMEFRVAGLKMP